VDNHCLTQQEYDDLLAQSRAAIPDVECNSPLECKKGTKDAYFTLRDECLEDQNNWLGSETETCREEGESGFCGICEEVLDIRCDNLLLECNVGSKEDYALSEKKCKEAGLVWLGDDTQTCRVAGDDGLCGKCSDLTCPSGYFCYVSETEFNSKVTACVDTDIYYANWVGTWGMNDCSVYGTRGSCGACTKTVKDTPVLPDEPDPGIPTAPPELPPDFPEYLSCSGGYTCYSSEAIMAINNEIKMGITSTCKSLQISGESCTLSGGATGTCAYCVQDVAVSEETMEEWEDPAPGLPEEAPTITNLACTSGICYTSSSSMNSAKAACVSDATYTRTWSSGAFCIVNGVSGTCGACTATYKGTYTVPDEPEPVPWTLFL
jgi:hypothetical protein